MMLLMMFLSVLMSLSAPSWWGMWISMELFNLFFIPYCCSTLKVITPSVWQFYVVQVVSSLMVLCSSFIFTTPGWMDFDKLNMILVMMFLMLVILMKMGFPPFHGWLLRISGEMPWVPFIFLATMGKIGPIVFLINLPNMGESASLFWLMMMSFGLISSFGALSESNIRHIFVYSSVLNLSWILVSSLYSSSMAVMMSISYFLSVVTLGFLLKEKGISQINDLYEGLSLMPLSMKVLFLVSFLNLIGFPPSLTFLIKLSILQMIGLSSISTALLMISIVFVYNYSKLIYFMTIKPSPTYSSFKFLKKKYSILGVTMPMILVMISLIYFLK